MPLRGCVVCHTNRRRRERLSNQHERNWIGVRYQVLDLALALCNALEYLHDVAVPGRIVCHRDLKPDNIAFSEDGTLKLIDFGLGKVTKDGEELRRVGGVEGGRCWPRRRSRDTHTRPVFVRCCCLSQGGVDGMLKVVSQYVRSWLGARLDLLSRSRFGACLSCPVRCLERASFPGVMRAHLVIRSPASEPPWQNARNLAALDHQAEVQSES